MPLAVIGLKWRIHPKKSGRGVSPFWCRIQWIFEEKSKPETMVFPWNLGGPVVSLNQSIEQLSLVDVQHIFPRNRMIRWRQRVNDFVLQIFWCTTLGHMQCKVDSLELGFNPRVPREIYATICQNGASPKMRIDAHRIFLGSPCSWLIHLLTSTQLLGFASCHLAH